MVYDYYFIGRVPVLVLTSCVKHHFLLDWKIRKTGEKNPHNPKHIN